MEKAREFLKNIYLCFIDAKAFDSVDHNKLLKILKEMGMPYHLTCFLRNLYADQETTVRIRHRTTYLFKIGKGFHQGCMLSPFLLICRVHHMKCWAGRITSWNQECQEKYQQPQIMQMIPLEWQKVKRN